MPAKPGAVPLGAAKASTTSSSVAASTANLKKGGAAAGKSTKSAGAPAGKAKKSAPPAAVAVVVAPRHSSVGMWSLSDGRLVTGYLLILGGALIVLLAIAVRRRDSGRVRVVTSAQITGER